MATCTKTPLNDVLDVLRNGQLTEEQAKKIVALGPDVAVFVILELSKRLAEQQAKIAAESHQTPGRPSGMKPPYRKPPTKPGKNRPGAKHGHPGSRRKTPERIDRKVEHSAKHCPDCGGKLKPCGKPRTRHIEDIPDVQPEVTEHTIHRGWCPKCKKLVEPAVPDALPKAYLGNRVLVLSAWLHYALGNTLRKS